MNSAASPPDGSTRAVLSRRSFLRWAGGVCSVAALGGPIVSSVRAAARNRPTLLEPAALDFLRELAVATVDSARIRPGEKRAGQGPNTTGFTLISPGGNYPALWTRDFAMSLDAGLIGAEEILTQLRLLAQTQNGARERRLASGAIIPPFAVVDHVNLAGGAVFYPGTYSAGEDQGADPWGPLPPIDDHYYFIHAAYAVFRDTRQTAFLHEVMSGIPLLDRLVGAFHATTSDPDTGAAVARRDRRAVGFGFQDSVYLLGSLAFTTLLRWRAARQLAELSAATGRARPARELRRIAQRIAAHVVSVFGDPRGRDGWLVAATEVGRQPDVWATLFALHLGVLPERAARRARQTIVEAVQAPGHTIEYEGGVRHVPSNRYYKPDQCWESSVSQVNTYQGGAFWHTPTGWLLEALWPTHPEVAREVGQRYLTHLRAQDFRRGEKRGAPWECFGLRMAGAQNPVYMTSVTLPLAVLQRLNLSVPGAKR